MPRRSPTDKTCRKCQRRQPLAAFFAGLAEWPTAPCGSPFCQTCRETFQRCPACGEDVSIVDIKRQKPSGGDMGARQRPQKEVCKRCYHEGLRRRCVRMAEFIADRERAAGRDPAEHPAYRFYTQSPEEILRLPGRRR